MGHLLSALFQTIRRNLTLFLAVVIIFITGNWIRNEWASARTFAGEVPALQTAHDAVSGHQAVLTHKVIEEVRQLSVAGVQRIDAGIHTIDGEINRLHREQEQDQVSMSKVLLTGASTVPDQLARNAMRKAEIELRRQQRDYLLTLRSHFDTVLNRQRAEKELEQLRQASLAAYKVYRTAFDRRAYIKANHSLLVQIPSTGAHNQVQELTAQIKGLQQSYEAAHKKFLAQQAVLARLPTGASPASFRVSDERLAAISAPLRERLLRAKSLVAENYIWQAYRIVRPVLPLAMGVLLGWWLVPAAIRALFYFVLAPLAARRPPIVIGALDRGNSSLLSEEPASSPDSTLISAVSQQILLAPDHEMLIRPDYCQSQPAGVEVDMQWLFNWRHWLPSIAAHLWMLKRLRASQAAHIVVSSTSDPLDEVAILEIAEGDAFVMQSRGVVGVIYKTGQRPKIRSHWRLGTLHAWLTLQLRYLAFDGPAVLIVKGCRGVRLESASTGRTISQDATLGFSTNASYTTVRADPFIPYLLGRQSLLRDKFTGYKAYYLYEEVPRKVRPGQPKHNPLEVLVDAGLKAFGI